MKDKDPRAKELYLGMVEFYPKVFGPKSTTAKEEYSKGYVPKGAGKAFMKQRNVYAEFNPSAAASDVPTTSPLNEVYVHHIGELNKQIDEVKQHSKQLINEVIDKGGDIDGFKSL